MPHRPPLSSNSRDPLPAGRLKGLSVVSGLTLLSRIVGLGRDILMAALFGTGWVLAVVWFAGVVGYGMWAFWQSSANIFERLLVFGGLSALALLFISVVFDRISSSRTDRYREVEK